VDYLTPEPVEDDDDDGGGGGLALLALMVGGLGLGGMGVLAFGTILLFRKTRSAPAEEAPTAAPSPPPSPDPYPAYQPVDDDPQANYIPLAEPHSPQDDVRRCPNCSAAIRSSARFCASCGTTLSSTPRCRYCGATLRSESRFCPQCGNSV
jgi:RNA polymerase subunit RPABC4/transcription elongation factor Spt4